MDRPEFYEFESDITDRTPPSNSVRSTAMFSEGVVKNPQKLYKENQTIEKQIIMPKIQEKPTSTEVVKDVSKHVSFETEEVKEIPQFKVSEELAPTDIPSGITVKVMQAGNEGYTDLSKVNTPNTNIIFPVAEEHKTVLWNIDHEDINKLKEKNMYGHQVQSANPNTLEQLNLMSHQMPAKIRNMKYMNSDSGYSGYQREVNRYTTYSNGEHSLNIC
jgi:hypothetical protein